MGRGRVDMDVDMDIWTGTDTFAGGSIPPSFSGVDTPRGGPGWGVATGAAVPVSGSRGGETVATDAGAGVDGWGGRDGENVDGNGPGLCATDVARNSDRDRK